MYRIAANTLLYFVYTIVYYKQLFYNLVPHFTAAHEKQGFRRRNEHFKKYVRILESLLERTKICTLSDGGIVKVVW